MKTRIVFLLVFCVTFLLAITGFAAAAPSAKVDVCHLEGNGSYHLININGNALSAHLNHGDGQPGDPVPGLDGKVFAEDCSVIDAAPDNIYDSIPAVYPGSFPSLGYEATSADEFGDHISFDGTSRSLDSVEVSLTNWACENDFDNVGGTWVPNRDGYAGEACVTTPGSFFNHPITLNIYEVDNSGVDPAVGSLIATVTDNFDIPFRPSWDSVNCTGTGQTPTTDIPFGGTWFDPVAGACVHGYAFNITFDFSTLGVTLPEEVIFGVAYNTANHGDSPLGTAGPYSSLNVSVTIDAATVGTNVEADTVFWDTSFAGFYCDSGAGGTDSFRRDSGCWGTYTPVVRFNAN